MQRTEENLDAVMLMCQQLTGLQKFQMSPIAWYGYARGVCAFIGDMEKGQWLMDEAITKFDTLPAPSVLRELYSTRWKPDDEKDPTTLGPATGM